MRNTVVDFLFFFGIILCLSLLQINCALAVNQTLWKQWYIFTKNSVPAGYYSETLEYKRDSNELHLVQNIWEKGLLGLENTFVTSIASKDERLNPISFYVKKRNKMTVDIYEGIINGKELGIRAHIGMENATPITNILPITPSSILGSFTSFYLAQQVSAQKTGPGKTIKFETILEEGDNGKFSPAKVVSQATDKFTSIKSEKCREYKLSFNDIPATWWVTDAGKICRMQIPSLGVELEMEAEGAAKKFL